MALTALLFAHHGAGAEGEPPAMLRVGGATVIARQIRQARRCGATRVIVVVERMPPALAAALEEAGVEVVRAVHGIVLSDEDRVLVIEDALVVDPRIIVAVLARQGSALAVWRGRDGREGAQRIDPSSHWAGVATYSGRSVTHVLNGIGDWDLQETLLRAAFNDGKPARVDVAAIDTYAPERRRQAVLLWAPIRSSADATRATGQLLAAGQKGCLDWPARYLHPWLEDVIVRALLDTRVKPDMITVATGLLGLVTALAFGAGWLWSGLILALLIGPLDGVDGKLARARHEFSRWGELEHGLDKLIDYSWYLAIAGHFAVTRDVAGPWAIAALIIITSAGEATQAELFRRLTGRQLDDAGRFERRFRLVAARRNTNIWSLVPFAVLGTWYAGFVWLAIYSEMTWAVAQTRFALRLARYARQHSPQIASNLDATAYDFLSRPGGSSN